VALVALCAALRRFGHQSTPPSTEPNHIAVAAPAIAHLEADDKNSPTRVSIVEEPLDPVATDREGAVERVPSELPFRAIDASVEDGLELDGEPYMHSSWRVSRGEEVHVKREIRADGVTRLLVDDQNGFSWDTLCIDLSRRKDGTIRAEAIVCWTADFGPPHDGTLGNLNGKVVLSSSNWSGADPLIVDFDVQGQGLDELVRENGRVVVTGTLPIGPMPR
jgi:hypothetical protein